MNRNTASCTLSKGVQAKGIEYSPHLIVYSPPAFAMSSPSPSPHPRRQRRRRSRRPSSTRSAASSESQEKDTLQSVSEDDGGSSISGDGEMMKREEQPSPVELHRRRMRDARLRELARSSGVFVESCARRIYYQAFTYFYSRVYN